MTARGSRLSPVVTAHMGPGLVRLLTGEGEQLFSLRALRTAKRGRERRCPSCDVPLKVGTEAWGEVTGSPLNRADRYCVRCIDHDPSEYTP